MKKLYFKRTFVLGSLIFINITSFAQSSLSCKAYEFNEMTSMTKKELEELYCKNDYLHQSNYKLGMDVTSSRESLKQARIYVDNMSACRTENERVMRAMRKLNAKWKEPECK